MKGDAMGEALRKEDAVAAPAPEKPLLTFQQIQILQWISNGKDNIEISLLMGLGRPQNVQAHVQRIMEKTNTASRSAAVAWALRNKVIV